MAQGVSCAVHARARGRGRRTVLERAERLLKPRELNDGGTQILQSAPNLGAYVVEKIIAASPATRPRCDGTLPIIAFTRGTALVGAQEAPGHEPAAAADYHGVPATVRPIGAVTRLRRPSVMREAGTAAVAPRPSTSRSASREPAVLRRAPDVGAGTGWLHPSAGRLQRCGRPVRRIVAQ